MTRVQFPTAYFHPRIERKEVIENLAKLLQWAHDNKVRVTWKFIPDQAPSPFVVEAQVPRPKAGKNYYEFVRRRGKDVGDVCARFLSYVE